MRDSDRTDVFIEQFCGVVRFVGTSARGRAHLRWNRLDLLVLPDGHAADYIAGMIGAGLNVRGERTRHL